MYFADVNSISFNVDKLFEKKGWIWGFFKIHIHFRRHL